MKIEDMRNQFLMGDSLDILKQMPDGCVDSIVTSPPYYGLRNYQVDGQIGLEPTIYEHVEKMMAIMTECKRVLADYGTLWLNYGDTYYGGGGTSGHTEDTKQFGKSNTLGKSYVNSTYRKTGEVQTKSMCMVPERVAMAMVDDGWVLRNKIIWCLSGDTKLYTKTKAGTKVQTLKDLARKERKDLYLWDGSKWNRLLQIIENKNPLNPIEIFLRNGETIKSTPEHIFMVKGSEKKADLLEVGDILDNCILPEGRLKPEMIIDEVGWFVGLYLAEGSMSKKTIQISNYDTQNGWGERLERLANMYGGTCNVHDYVITLSGKILNALLNTYLTGKDCRTKHLTSKVWEMSNDFLKSLLMGYLDGDGHYDSKNDRWRLTFAKNNKLADNLRTIGAKLGIFVRVKNAYTIYNNKKIAIHRGQLRFIKSGHHNNRSEFEIIDIRIPRKYKTRYWDIILEDEPHIFALSSGVLVHNCKPSVVPQSAKDRFTNDWEYLYFFAKKPKGYYFEQQFEESMTGGNTRVWKDNTPSQDNDMIKNSGANFRERLIAGDVHTVAPMRNCRSVWKVASQPVKEAHFATFPFKLIERPIRAGCPEFVCKKCGVPKRKVILKSVVEDAFNIRVRDVQKGRIKDSGRVASKEEVLNYNEKDYQIPEKELVISKGCDCNAGFRKGIVMDIFMGSGTTAIVARALDRDFVGIELNPEYIEIAEKRMRQWPKERVLKFLKGESAPEPSSKVVYSKTLEDWDYSKEEIE